MTIFLVMKRGEFSVSLEVVVTILLVLIALALFFFYTMGGLNGLAQ